MAAGFETFIAAYDELPPGAGCIDTAEFLFRVHALARIVGNENFMTKQ